MEKRLDELLISEVGKVKEVKGDGRVRRRLLDMGLTPGAIITVKKKAPLGDPIEITIRGYELSLRRDECSLILMEV